MSKDPAFLFYSSDFLTGTMFMTDQQIGQYIKLLCIQHQKGSISETEFLNICRDCDKIILDKFFKDNSGKYINQRLLDEMTKRKNYTESRRKNRLGKTKEHMLNISKTYDKHMENRNENENINKNKNEIKVELYPTHEDFWNEYNKKRGKQKSIKAWNKLNQKTKEEIMAYIPAYVESTPNIEFRKDPATFLNNEGWKDELIIKENDKKNKGYSTSFKQRIIKKMATK